MKSESEIRSQLERELQLRDKLLAELNSSVGRIQALQFVLAEVIAAEDPVDGNSVQG